ncbi:putative ribonuclease H-like domain-containing protein [Tanacetum coccineum]
MTDYSLWEVILNGNKVLTRTVREVVQEYEPTSIEEKQDRRNEMKARGTLLMALPNKDQLKFHSYKDAKLFMEAIEKMYGGNKDSKKVQRTLLKQQYENFAGSSSEAMDQTFDRLQKLISQLEIQGEVITQEDMNLKLLRTDNTAYGVSAAHTQSNPTFGDNFSDAVICAFLASQPNFPQLAQEDLEQINPNDLEEMDLQWEMAMRTIRARRFIKRTGRKLDVNGQRVGFDRGIESSRRTVTVETHTENSLVTKDGIGGYDWSYQAEEEHPTNYALMTYTSSGSSSSSDSEVDSCSKSCLESVEARLAHYKKNKVVFEESINILNLQVKLRDNALGENKKKLEKAKKRDELKLTLEKFQNSSKSLNNLLESQVIDKFKTGLGYNAASSTVASPAVESFGYHAVLPPYTGNFIPFKPDLTFMDEIVESENMDVITIVTPRNVKKFESNQESADVQNNGDAVEPKTVRKNSFRPLVTEDWNSDEDSEVEFIPNVEDKIVIPSTKKIKFVKSARETVEKFEHLHNVCDKKVIRPAWNNSSRVNHKNFANKMTHPHPNRRFALQSVLTRSGKINTVGASVNTAVIPVNTGNPQQREYKEKGVIESGFSRHMTRNKCYLTKYKDYDGGFVSFGDGKGRISGKGKIKIGTLDFDNVYFCKELKYNMFSVSQIYDKKNNVLFTDTECLVLSSDFKLLDESQVLLRVPRKDNIYSVDLKSVVPTKGLTCLFDKATIDVSNLWHRRLGYINFKNMNKLVRGNLVRGLPLKIFENDHSCVACQKGKQHKASCKAKLVNSISKPLHMLHMDLFDPTNVKSLMKKSHCLVVTNDFSRFSWVFFLATKDETSGILKTFIIEIENQLDYKVKVIKSDNGTEFKNIVINQFCEINDNVTYNDNLKCWPACCRITRKGTGGRAGSGGGRTRGRSGDQDNGRDDGPGGQVGGQGSEMNGGVNGVLDFSTIITQQLQNLLPTIVAQVGDQGIGQGNGRNQNGDAINDHIRGDDGNAFKINDRRGCTYKEFLACNTKKYDGKGGAIVYTCWIEKMESVHDMSGCRDSQRVKYTAGSFVCKVLTWWNFKIHTRGREVAIGMSWEDFRTLTREEFYLSNEMQKLETELWIYAMVGVGHAAYTDRFHELAMLVPH